VRWDAARKGLCHIVLDHRGFYPVDDVPSRGAGFGVALEPSSLSAFLGGEASVALIERIRAAEAGLARLAAASDTTRFAAYTESSQCQPPAEAVELLRRIGAAIGW